MHNLPGSESRQKGDTLRLLRKAWERRGHGGRYEGRSIWGMAVFIERMQQHVEARVRADVQIPQAQRRPPATPLVEIARKEASREAAIVAAYATGAYSYQDIAEYFGVHFTTVGRIVRKARRTRTE